MRRMRSEHHGMNVRRVVTGIRLAGQSVVIGGGKGGNFGVVTALEYQLHPVGEVVSGALMYVAGRIPELLQAFVRFFAGVPDEMDALAQLLPSERGPRLKIDVCYCGDPRTGNDLLRPLRALNPQDDDVKIMSYLEARGAGGFLQAPVAHFQTNLFLRELSGAAITAITTAIMELMGSKPKRSM
jgi:hypothetical protein